MEEDSSLLSICKTLSKNQCWKVGQYTVCICFQLGWEQESSGPCVIIVLSDGRLTDQEPRLIEWGKLKVKFRAAAAVRSDEMECAEVSGDVPDGWWVKIWGMDNLGRFLLVNFSLAALPKGNARLLLLSSLDPPGIAASVSGDGVMKTEGKGATIVKLWDRTFVDGAGELGLLLGPLPVPAKLSLRDSIDFNAFFSFFLQPISNAVVTSRQIGCLKNVKIQTTGKRPHHTTIITWWRRNKRKEYPSFQYQSPRTTCEQRYTVLSQYRDLLVQ